MHKAWSSIEEVPYCFSRSSVKFEVTRDKKIINFDPIGRFRTVTPVWIHWWLWNDAQSLKQHRRAALLYSKVIHQISKSHGTQNMPISIWIERFRTVASVGVHRWLWNDAPRLDILQKRCPIVLQGHPLVLKVTWDKNCGIDPNLGFNSVWIHLWI